MPPVTNLTPVRRYLPLITALALAFVVVGCSFSAWIAVRNASKLKEEQRENQSLVTGAITTSLSQFIRQQTQILEVLASSESFQSNNVSAIDQRLRRLSSTTNDFTGGVAWVDARGIIRASSISSPRRVGLNVADRTYTKTVLTEGRPAIQVVLGRASDTPLVVIAVPTRSSDNRISGVLTGSLQITTLQDLMKSLAPEGREMHIVDTEGQVIASDVRGSIQSVDPSSPYQRMMEAGRGIEDGVTGLTGLPDRLIAFQVMEYTDWLVALSSPRGDVYSSANQSLINELIAIAVALGVMTIGVLLAFRRIRMEQTDGDERRASSDRLREIAQRFIAAATDDDVNTITTQAVAALPDTHWAVLFGRPRDRNGADGAEHLTQAGDAPQGLSTLTVPEDLPDRIAVLTPEQRRRLDADGLMADPVILSVPIHGGEGTQVLLAGMATPPSEADLDEIRMHAENAVQARERAELILRERTARARTDLVARITGGVESEIGVEKRMRVLASALVPGFADMAVIEMPTPQGGSRIVASAGVAYQTDDAIGILDLASDQGPLVLTSEDVRRLEVSDRDASYLVVPMGQTEDPIAAVLLGRRAGVQPFVADELMVARVVVDRVSVAIHQARLYEEQRDIAFTLQRNLLGPTSVAINEQLRVEAEYRPAVNTMSVGGDWFDVIQRPDGRVALAIGDVVGHGLAAAATMGKLSSALHALALGTTNPTELLQQLDAFARRSDGGGMATLAYLVIDLHTGDIDYIVAGHPPPLVIAPNGRASFLWEGRGSPLAVFRHGDASMASTRIEPGSKIILYTDGLIERRGEPIDDSLDRLRHNAAAHNQDDPRAMTHAIISAMLDDHPQTDDVVTLVASVDRLGRMFHREYAAQPDQLVEIRRTVGAWMEESPAIDEMLTQDVLLGLDEAVSNAIEHAYFGEAPDPISVVIRLHESAERLIVTVTDNGRWRAQSTGPDRGRGLGIMRRLFDDVAIRTNESGTEIRMERALHATVGAE